jgi:hypothetical protein
MAVQQKLAELLRVEAEASCVADTLAEKDVVRAREHLALACSTRRVRQATTSTPLLPSRAPPCLGPDRWCSSSTRPTAG